MDGQIRFESGYVWMGKFDLNRDTSGREQFLIGKEQVADSKISGSVWQSKVTKEVN